MIMGEQLTGDVIETSKKGFIFGEILNRRKKLLWHTILLDEKDNPFIALRKENIATMIKFTKNGSKIILHEYVRKYPNLETEKIYFDKKCEFEFNINDTNSGVPNNYIDIINVVLDIQ